MLVTEPIPMRKQIRMALISTAVVTAFSILFWWGVKKDFWEVHLLRNLLMCLGQGVAVGIGNFFFYKKQQAKKPA